MYIIVSYKAPHDETMDHHINEVLYIGLLKSTNKNWKFFEVGENEFDEIITSNSLCNMLYTFEIRTIGQIYNTHGLWDVSFIKNKPVISRYEMKI